MPSYAEWVSTLALGLSGGGLIWQIARARREQPVISVDGQWSVTRDGRQGWTEASWTFPIHVTNAGGRALTVRDVYWELVGEHGPFRIQSGDMGSTLPTRLEALSADAWEVRAPIQGSNWEGLIARPAADVVLGKGVTAVYGPPSILSLPPDIDFG